jgi:hypothetical protein
VSNQSTKKEMKMNEVDQYRDYFDSVRPPAKPAAHVSDLDLIAATSVMRIWSMKTKHPLDAVLGDGFFDDVADLRLRSNDRIELICDTDADVAIHGTLVVDSADKHGHATVSLLHRYERSQ